MSSQGEICEEGGLLFPVVGGGRGSELLSAGYTLGLLWVMMGVSALTERLMEAVAVITSKARWIDDAPDEDGQPTQVEVLAWNPTVANLTLMAIGSSAPEILLSTIELTAGRGYSGEMGPMTIVGSAAFNLFLVSAICVTAVPAGETRALQNHGVFTVTAVMSILAYAWLIAILAVWTPDVVTVWEASLTLGLLPVFVFVAYSADKGDLQKRLGDLDEVIEALEAKIDEGIHAAEDLVGTAADVTGLTKLADETGLSAVASLLDKKLLEQKLFGAASDADADADASPREGEGGQRAKGRELSRLMAKYELDSVRGARRRFKVELEDGESYVHFKPFQVASILQGNTKTLSVQRAAQVVAWVGQQKTRADYRIQANHVMMGETTAATSNALLATGRKGLLKNAVDTTDERVVGFASTNVVCSESDGSVTVNVERHGDITARLRVDYFTRDGTATGGSNQSSGADYQHKSGTLVFEPYESQLSIEVVVYSDFAVEDDETFEIVLANPVDGQSGGEVGLLRGPARAARQKELVPTILSRSCVVVTIMDDDTRGSIGFVQTHETKGCTFTAVESTGRACIPVRRRGLTKQNMSCKFRTFRGSATPGLAGQNGCDYENTFEWAAGGLDGELVFLPGEMTKDITIDVFDTESYLKSDTFFVQLIDPQNCVLRNLTVAHVTISHDVAVQAFASAVIVQLAKDAKGKQPPNRYRAQQRVQVRSDFDTTSEVVTELEIGHEITALETRRTEDGRVRVRFAPYEGPAGWCSVTTVDGDVLLAPIPAKKSAKLVRETKKAAAAANTADAEKQNVFVLILRFALLPWRILCGITPTPDVMGGWPCFVSAFVMICCVTVVIYELAGLVSCAFGFTPSTIAIVLIAGGTSLPDLYASRSAAMGDVTADSAVGNVMGSNAVNIFLGLGMPWTVAAIYWEVVGASSEWLARVDEDFPQLRQHYPSGAFVVPARDLCFAAGTFLVCASVFVVIILNRRRHLGYELGGEQRMEVGAVFLFMWLFSVALSVCSFNGVFDGAGAAADAVKSRTETFLRGESDAVRNSVGGTMEAGSWASTQSENSSSWNISESDASSASGSGDGDGFTVDEEVDPVHELLLSVMWVFLMLAGVGSSMVCWLKHEREEREQILRDQIAETRSMIYMEHGHPDHPEVWKLNHTLAMQGRECWARDYAGEGNLGRVQSVKTHEEHAATGHQLWAEQLQVFRRYGDALPITPVDVARE